MDAPLAFGHHLMALMAPLMAPGAVALGIVLPHGQPSPTVPDELKIRIFGLGVLMMPPKSTVSNLDLDPNFLVTHS